MKGSVHPKNDVTINPSGNESILDVLGRVESGRRRFLKTTLSSSALAAMGGVSSLGLIQAVEAAPVADGNGFGGIGFESIPPSVATLDPATGSIVTPIADMVKVPAGYKVEVLAAWGDPVTPAGAPWAEDVSQGAAEQEQQFGMHNDGMHYFPFPERGGSIGRANINSSERGLLCVNHEYTHEAILHPGGLTPVSIAKVRKSQAAHGVSVAEVRRNGGTWSVRAHSAFGRRVTANTQMRVSGPAAGNALLQSKKYDIRADGSFENGLNDGFEANGTANNCAHGWTPWGTYIACEENWNGYFGTATFPYTPTKLQRRYGVTAGGFGYQWHVVDDRFDIVKNPLEPNMFGWAVEIDPFDPDSVPVKRTAMGRFKRESAQVAMDRQDRVAFYQGDDERNEYIYKFVCARPFNPRKRAANRDLLDTGVLYVAKFTDAPTSGKPAGNYRGRWIPLVPDQEAEAWPVDAALGRKPKLRELAEFAAPTDEEVQGLILVKTRMAADAVGATMMDRPEWVALRTYREGRSPANGYTNTYGPERPLELYCTLTNNSRRGNGPRSSNAFDGSTTAATANPPVDVANPRPDNDYGHIIRWREDGNVVTALGFDWDIFALCGDTQVAAHVPSPKTLGTSYQMASPGIPANYEGNITDVPNGSADFGAPDGLWFDYFGRLWIQTDQAGDASGDWQKVGSNTMSCADPNTKEIRRFLTSPVQCEVTGVITTPDGRAMFCGIQHPGEDAGPAQPDQFSNWPQSQFATNSAGQTLPNTPGKRRPRSSVLVITREDGGVIGD